MSKKELIDLVSDSVKQCSKKDVAEIIDTFLMKIKTSMKKEKVQIAGFGTFQVKQRKARTGINPATKKKIQIAAKKVATFKPASELKEAVNKK